MGMCPKEKMIEFCKMQPCEQMCNKKEILESLQDFLSECTLEELDELNFRNHETRPGLFLSAEIILCLGSYGYRFFNQPREILGQL